MKIIDDFNLRDLVSLILERAKYQKVLFLYDKSDEPLCEEIKSKIKKEAIICECNYFLCADISSQIRSGYKLIITKLSDENLFKVLDYLDETETVIIRDDENLWPINFYPLNSRVFNISSEKSLSNVDKLLLANLYIELKWNSILSYKDIAQVLPIKELILKGEASVEGFLNLSLPFKSIYLGMKQILMDIKEENVENFLYLRLIIIKFLFFSFQNNEIQLLDTYKEFENDEENIALCFSMLSDENANFILKNYSEYMGQEINEIISKINIKKILEIDKKEFKNLINYLIFYVQSLKKDNLLKFSYLFNIFSLF